MRSCEVLIVGGGPAGATAAWKLRRAGKDVLVLDRERFPRLKLCAGWITPEVVRDLDMDLASYPHRLLTFPRLRVHWGRLHVPVPCVQHSIRRFEFDAWLLERSGAPLEQPRVPFEAADGMLHARHRQVEPPVVHAQAREGEQPMRVGVEIHLELAHHFRRDPAGAQLQAREGLAIEHQDIGAGAPQLPGGGRARGPSADDEDIT